MTELLRQGGFVYEPLNPENFAAACYCVAETFTQHEPLTVAQQVTLEEHLEFAHLFVARAMEEGLSVVAKLEYQPERVVGVRISEDYWSEVPEGVEQLSPKMDPIFNLLDGMSARYKQSREPARGKYLHMFMVGVSKECRGSSVAKTMYQEAFKIAKARGYEVAIAEATGVKSQGLLKKFGFREIFRVDYDEFEFEGSRPFCNLDPHKACALMENEITI